MFIKKKYQIKDLIDTFGISRDAIKYYEQAGLISSIRKENGYREFDEFNVLKLKKVLYFRDMNMTVDEIIRHFESGSVPERMEVMRGVRLRTEHEILELSKKLKKIRILEAEVSNNLLFSDSFNLGNDLYLCVDCPYVTDKEDKIFYIKAGFTAHFSVLNRLENIQHHNFIVGDHTVCDHCVGCEKRICYKEYYRARVYFEDREQLEQLLNRQFDDMALQGLHPDKKIYVIKKIVKKDRKDCWIFDIFLPLTE